MRRADSILTNNNTDLGECERKTIDFGKLSSNWEWGDSQIELLYRLESC